MPETIEELVKQAIAAAQAAGDLTEFEVGDCGIERPADSGNGDWTSTVAMRSARLAHCAPAKIAAAIVKHMPSDERIAKVEVAGPGFINFYLSSAANNEVFRTVREAGADWGKVDEGKGLRTQVEFISANPTGPLHVGHGRWAAIGDSLCNVMEHAGFDIQREYYINDHGSQMEVFGKSVEKRYMQLIEVMEKEGCDVEAAAAALLADREAYVDDDFDELDTHPYMDAFNEALGGNSYGGDYIIGIAKEFYETDGDKWVNADPEERLAEFNERSYQMMLQQIKDTCHQVRCDFDEWRSERSFYVKDESGTSYIDRTFKMLEDKGLLYRTEDGALWFKSTDFGDDKDRVLIKSNGEYTYFASDVAYCWKKFEIVDYEINIWGADHHGYIKRVQSVADAMGFPGKYEILLGQFVNLLRNGEPVRMSKRKGTMISFQELVDMVGVDATRYTLISRSSNQTIDFDIEKVKKQDNTNPVYYVQYAHARICSILRRAAGVTEAEAAEMGMDAVAQKAIGDNVNLGLLTEPTELALSRKISEFPELVASCARDRAPFRLTHFCEELAGAFHAFYANCQVLPSEGRPVDPELSRARLAACDAVRINLEVALRLIGVSAPEVM
ncbi:MAG: arginine--tRNA ligase [Atopobiaceae bacterium]|nr:arginine--tRNA ligase [Atopobiaceae bacterium]